MEIEAEAAPKVLLKQPRAKASLAREKSASVSFQSAHVVRHMCSSKVEGV